MISQVVIQDNERRMVYLLDEADFALQRQCCLPGMNGHSDLKPAHFHHVIQKLLDTLSSMSDAECSDKINPTVQHLTFFLCSLIDSLQDRIDGHVDLLRITRHPPHLSYDFTATLNLQ